MMSGESVACWAGEAVGIAPTASSGEVQQAWLVHLAGSGMLPAQDAFEAFATLLPELDARDETPPAYLAARRAAAAEEVAALASEFFWLTPADRRARIEALDSACDPHSAAAARLDRLEAAVNVRLPSRAEGDPEILETFSSQVARASIAVPAVSASIRRELLVRSASWESVASVLEQQHRHLAALEPELVARLANARQYARARRRLQARHTRKESGHLFPAWVVPSGVAIAIVFVVVGVFIAAKNEQATHPFAYSSSVPPVMEFSLRTADQIGRKGFAGWAKGDSHGDSVDVQSTLQQWQFQYSDLRDWYIGRVRRGESAKNIKRLSEIEEELAELTAERAKLRSKVDASHKDLQANPEDQAAVIIYVTLAGKLSANQKEASRLAFEVYLLKLWQRRYPGNAEQLPSIPETISMDLYEEADGAWWLYAADEEDALQLPIYP